MKQWIGGVLLVLPVLAWADDNELSREALDKAMEPVFMQSCMQSSEKMKNSQINLDMQRFCECSFKRSFDGMSADAMVTALIAMGSETGDKEEKAKMQAKAERAGVMCVLQQMGEAKP